MIFPVTDLLDDQESLEWLEKYFHPKGLRCPSCRATTQLARVFRTHKRGFVDYRCQKCQSVYNLYTGTLFAGSNLEPRRVVLLLRGVCKGDPSTVLSEELSLSRQCVHRWRCPIQANAYEMLSRSALTDSDTETDEMFPQRGKKGENTAIPSVRRAGEAHKRKGHGTYENDRPSVVGTVGRESGQCRLRVREHTDSKTLNEHVHGSTKKEATCYTDEWQGYNKINRTHRHGMSREERVGER